jgi:hypothetical protein
MVGRAAYHLELHVQRVVVPAAAAGVAAVLDVDVDVVVSRAPEHAGGSSRRRRPPAEDAPVRVAGARLLPLRHRRQIELRVSVRGSSVRYSSSGR